MNRPWQQVTQLPDGPVTLWIIVIGETGELIGAAPARLMPAWTWQHGKLCVAYGPVQVEVTAPGRIAYGLIAAVSEKGRSYVPVWRISLGEPQPVTPGMSISVLDGVIALSPDQAPGARSAPAPARELPPARR